MRSLKEGATFILHTVCGMLVIAVDGGNDFEFQQARGAKDYTSQYPR